MPPAARGLAATQPHALRLHREERLEAQAQPGESGRSPGNPRGFPKSALSGEDAHSALLLSDISSSAARSGGDHEATCTDKRPEQRGLI